MKKSVMVLAMIVITFSSSFSQTLEESIKNLATNAAKGYVAPLVSSFGSNVNGGLFHNAPAAEKVGFDFEFGIVGMGTFMRNDNNSTFSVQESFKFNKEQATDLVSFVEDGIFTTEQKAKLQTSYGAAYVDTIKNQLINAIVGSNFSAKISGPTLVGKKNDSVNVSFQGSPIKYTVLRVGGQDIEQDSFDVAKLAPIVNLPVTGILEDIAILPHLAPQIGIGTILGTRFTFRWLPNIALNSNVGKFSLSGWGVQHNPAVWFDSPLPIDVALSYFSQKITLGTLFTSKFTSYGLTASKRLGIGLANITPYAGFLLERSTMNFSYEYNEATPLGTTVSIPINFELQGENTSRIVVGLSAHLVFVTLNVDYNIAKYKSITTGLMFSL